MKALSIRQPWASLIVHGIKDIENRTWACPKKYIGQRVLIHASAKAERSLFANMDDKQIECVNGSNLDLSNLAHPLGYIIGSVEIVGCSINHPSVWAEKTDRYYEKPIYNWVLANPVLFEEPIPAKGKLSFWESGISEEGGKP